MERRSFLRKSGGAILLMASSANISNAGISNKIRFGLVADAHFARTETLWARYYVQSKAKLNDAINTFNDSDLDFVIELGDFKDEGNPPNREETIEFLVEIEDVLSRSRGPVYHVLGNHDMDSNLICMYGSPRQYQITLFQ